MNTGAKHQTIKTEEESHRFASWPIADFVEAQDSTLKSPTVKTWSSHNVFEADSASDPGTVHPLEEADLLPFLGNHLNYHARRSAIFRKDYDAMPLLSEADFAPPES